MAVSDSLYGPWKRTDEPIDPADPDPAAWNSMCTTNPFCSIPMGSYGSIIKSWSIQDWEYDLVRSGRIRTNRQYGLAKATDLHGSWKKVGEGPMIDLRHVGHNARSEDAYIWMEEGPFV